jgi:hypothetical protein
MKSLQAPICVLCTGLTGQQHSELMTKLTVHLLSPDIRQESFAAKPKTMYRFAKAYCRTAEAPDLENGIHGLTVIHEPDVWMVNFCRVPFVASIKRN